jgi:hypothetical protein
MPRPRQTEVTPSLILLRPRFVLHFLHPASLLQPIQNPVQIARSDCHTTTGQLVHPLGERIAVGGRFGECGQDHQLDLLHTGPPVAVWRTVYSYGV